MPVLAALTLVTVLKELLTWPLVAVGIPLDIHGLLLFPCSPALEGI